MTAFLHFPHEILFGLDQPFADAFQVLLLAFDAEAHDDDGDSGEDQGEHVEDTGEAEAPGQQGTDHHGRSHAAKAAEAAAQPLPRRG